MPCTIAAQHWVQDVENDDTEPGCFCPHCTGECDCDGPHPARIVARYDVWDPPRIDESACPKCGAPWDGRRREGSQCGMCHLQSVADQE